MQLKERVKRYCIHANIGVSTFERLAKLSNGYFNQVKKEPSFSKLSQIAVAFPELNIEWLRTGEGEMLNDINDGQITQNTDNMEIERLLNIIENQSRQMDKAQVQIDNAQAMTARLLAIIEQMQGLTPQKVDTPPLRQISKFNRESAE